MDIGNIKDGITNALTTVKKPEVAVLLGAAAYGVQKFRSKSQDDAGSNVHQDPFKLSNFTAALKADGFRLAKGYYYNAFLYFSDRPEILEPLVFQCNKVTLPGWRAKTQTGKIYAIEYEIAIEIQQDPCWLSFNVDIRHAIEEYFMNARKISTFSKTSYSPEYKSKYQFQMMIQVTDENFVPMYEYNLNNATVKTIQNINYGSSASETPQVVVEVVYETMSVVDVLTVRKSSKANPDAINKNQLKIGPFSADISLVNQVKDTISKVPQWFTGAEKI